jgi:hypothetical protein
LEHNEQVQRVTEADASLTSNCVWPQWQLPLIGTIRSFPIDTSSS